MNYLYHRVPDNLEGHILHPLNELKDIFPDAYQKNLKKYEGREGIMEQKIPFLNCLWNDVLHFSAVNPSEIKAELKRYGKDMLHNRFFQIDPFSLEPERTVIYLYRHNLRKEKMNEENFARYNPATIEEYAVFPDETKEYYKEMLEKGDNPLLWHRVPHFLYKGHLDITGVEILEV